MKGRGQPKKPRKQRPCYSCPECRRLRIKCDRQVPCSNCVRRNRSDTCTGLQPNLFPAGSKRRRPHEQDTSQDPQSTLPDKGPPVDSLNNSLNSDQSLQQPSWAAVGGAEDQNLAHSMPAPQHENQGRLGRLGQISQHAQQSEVTGQPSRSPLTGTPTGSTSHLYGNVSDVGTARSNLGPQPSDDGDMNVSYGTLLLDKGGRSKYLGPTAGSEWLKDSETRDASAEHVYTRPASPESPSVPGWNQGANVAPAIGHSAFPFSSSPTRIRTRDLLRGLPPRSEAWTLAESYYRYCAWHHDVAPRSAFEKTFQRVYAHVETSGCPLPQVNPQEFALVFIILAQGAMFNIEMASDDASAKEWLHLSEMAMIKGCFISNNTVAGLQVLHLMAHLHLQLDDSGRGDNAWPLWGIVMRQIQAMGMHRDGARWNLPEDIVEERRKVFWECNTADIFQAHIFSRPSTMNPKHYDTLFPTPTSGLRAEDSYSHLRFKLSQLSSEILSMAMEVQKSDYSAVIALDAKLCEFDRNLPFSIRCRAACLAMPSRYSRPEDACDASPEPSKRDMTLSFQQANLALNIAETFVNLHRPYYAKALYENIDDRVKSVYAQSYLTVIERCSVILALVADIHGRFPAISAKQWNFWFHVFGCALCLGTLVLRDPGNTMAPYVLTQIDSAISLFLSLLQLGGHTSRYDRNLQWLIKLRNRASSKIARAMADLERPNEQNTTDMVSGEKDNQLEDADTEDVELLGWRTRLVQRADQGDSTVRTIPFPPAPAILGTMDATRHLPRLNQPEQAQQDNNSPGGLMANTSFPLEIGSTDDLLHNFWDPMLPQDIFAAPNGQFSQDTTLNTNLAWWDSEANAWPRTANVHNS